uniref:Uncharacterized protein n=2 Tax=Ditylenchus dipsaci TaxID=166011 RepID=A0A915CMG5_9BILA
MRTICALIAIAAFCLVVHAKAKCRPKNKLLAEPSKPLTLPNNITNKDEWKHWFFLTTWPTLDMCSKTNNECEKNGASCPALTERCQTMASAWIYFAYHTSDARWKQCNENGKSSFNKEKCEKDHNPYFDRPEEKQIQVRRDSCKRARDDCFASMRLKAIEVVKL